jgi:predicted enzyme related to lactoylglutathione lyase
MKKPVVYFEVAARDVKKLKGFYARAFGWAFEKGPHEGVHTTEAGGRPGIPGFLVERGERIRDYVSLYVDVESIKKVVAIFEKHGGSVIRPPFSPDGINQVCIVADPEGHLFSLSERARKRPKKKRLRRS